jgi:hypothetical protein
MDLLFGFAGSKAITRKCLSVQTAKLGDAGRGQYCLFESGTSSKSRASYHRWPMHFAATTTHCNYWHASSWIILPEAENAI